MIWYFFIKYLDPHVHLSRVIGDMLALQRPITRKYLRFYATTCTIYPTNKVTTRYIFSQERWLHDIEEPNTWWHKNRQNLGIVRFQNKRSLKMQQRNPTQTKTRGLNTRTKTSRKCISYSNPRELSTFVYVPLSCIFSAPTNRREYTVWFSHGMISAKQ